MGLSNNHRNLEADQLKLGAEHFPFPCTLRELVLDRYAVNNANSATDSHSMPIEELLGYLQDTTEFELNPWAAVANQTEAIGDPAQPSRDQQAVMQWLGKAMDLWEEDFPLEEPLVKELQRLKPLCAALAMVDPTFLFPGAHPIHRLLDAIQVRAVGWQTTLDRVGAILEKQITKAVDDARVWFEDQNTDLGKVFTDFSTSVERDQSRAERMLQRVIDTERGKVKTLAAKSEAARMINAALEKFSLPQEIEEFIKGPWYTSAQLLLLKFGADSDQWQRMTETTETLLDSLQSLESAGEERRQYIFEVVTQLPKEMRRWLLSLHHDTEAVNEAMGLVEYTHLRILRRQPVELVQLEPIDINSPDEPANAMANSADGCQERSWYLIGHGNESQLRLQLALKSEATREYLFTNLAGIKVMQLGASEFTGMLNSEKAKLLETGQSFSRSLAKAAGIESAELLVALAEALGSIRDGTLPHSSVEAALEAEKQGYTDDTDAPPTSASEAANQDGIRSGGTQGGAGEPAHSAASKMAGAANAKAGPTETPEVVPEEPQAEELGVLSRGFRPESAMGEGFLAQQALDMERLGTVTTEEEAILDEELATQTAPEEDAARKVKLPMGTWLGFHDEETPIMGRLAVHDPVEDQFIFVNRRGFKLRSLTEAQLLQLIDDGLVDILQRSSNLRDQVIEVRESLDTSKQRN